MTSKSLSIFNQLRPVTVGFDPVFDRFERMFDDDFFNAPTFNTSYPPYNIVKQVITHTILNWHLLVLAKRTLMYHTKTVW